MLHTIRNTIQSSCFLASSAAAFQALMCGKSALFETDWKYSYWLMGALAGGAGILIEKKPRRSELALYVSIKRSKCVLYECLVVAKSFTGPLSSND